MINKMKKLSITLTIISLFLIYFFFLKTNGSIEKETFSKKENLSFIESTEVKVDKIELKNYTEKKITTNLKKNNIIKKPKEKPDIKNKEKKFILASSIDSKQKFKISLISKKEYEKDFYKEKNTSKYISISGRIETDEYQAFYPMSFEEKYLELANDLYLEVENILTKQVYLCEGYFFSGMDSQVSYDIKLDLYEASLDCYINSQSANKLEKSINERKVVKSIDDIKKKDKLELPF